MKKLFIALLLLNCFVANAMTLARRMTTRLRNGHMNHRLLISSPNLLKKFNSTKSIQRLPDILIQVKDLNKQIAENQLRKSRLDYLVTASATGNNTCVTNSIIPYVFGASFMAGMGYTGISVSLLFVMMHHFFKKNNDIKNTDDLMKLIDINQMRINALYGHLIYDVSLIPECSNLAGLDWKYRDFEVLIERLKNYEQSLLEAIEQDKKIMSE